MSNGIYNLNEPFSFEHVTLNPPVVTSGGNYFIKYSIDKKPLYIQPPECKTKGGISKNSKKPYCDLMFTNEHHQLIKWMEDLESRTCQLIYENSKEWFEGDMELSDIENYFASPMKIYKGGKFYLVRANIPSRLGNIHLKVYNEHKEEVSIDDIVENTNVLTVLEVQGIKCSARSFQIEMEVKQLMTLEPVNLFDNCLIHVKESDNKNTKTVTEKEEIPQYLEETKEKTETLEQNGESELESIPISLEENDLNREVIQENKTNLEEGANQEVERNVEDIQENKTILEEPRLPDELDNLEFTVDLEKLDEEAVILKPHNDIYYERYKEARKRAKIAKNLALQSFLEAKEIKHKYNLEDIDSDSDEEYLQDNSEKSNNLESEET